jgi:hypothetical protein
MAQTVVIWIINCAFFAYLVSCDENSCSESNRNVNLRSEGGVLAFEDAEGNEEGPCVVGLTEGLARMNGVKVTDSQGILRFSIFIFNPFFYKTQVN